MTVNIGYWAWERICISTAERDGGQCPNLQILDCITQEHLDDVCGCGYLFSEAFLIFSIASQSGPKKYCLFVVHNGVISAKKIWYCFVYRSEKWEAGGNQYKAHEYLQPISL